VPRLLERLRRRLSPRRTEAGSDAAPQGAAPESLPAPIEKLVVGLGNPGPEYAATRHNAGFLVVDALARTHGIALDAERFHGRFAVGPVADRRVGLLLPMTFMNASGAAVEAALGAFPGLDPATDVLVVFDDLDLPTGRLRLRQSGGAGGHRGLGDILARLDTKAVPRLRFGIDRPGGAQPVIDYVLGAFENEEADVIDERLPTAVAAIETFVAEGIVPAMNRFNRLDAESSSPV